MSEDRTLASIRRVSAVEPIEGYDRIELCHIGGWKVVVAKSNEIKPGDLVVYCEIDSILPKWKMFEFMERYKYRLRTIKLGGKLSQGLVLPLKDLKLIENPKAKYHGEHQLMQRVWETERGHLKETLLPLEEGYDLTDILCITKYEPEIRGDIGGDTRGNFPFWCVKTDEERIQNLEGFAELFNGLEFVVTEKIDGTSCTMTCEPKEDGGIGEFHVAGRNTDIKESDTNAFWMCARAHDIEKAIRHEHEIHGVNYALQGEVTGPGIQGNMYKLKKPEFFVYNIFDTGKQQYVPWDTIKSFCDMYGIQHVPYIGHLKIDKDITQDFLFNFAVGYSLIGTVDQNVREGIVLRHTVIDNFDYSTIARYAAEKKVVIFSFGKLSFKVVSNEYLLKHPDK